MTLSDLTALLSILCILVGCVFFLAGTVGLLRLPDVFTRLHALTKADNVGLGLVVIGVGLQTDSAAVIVKLFLIWALVLLTSATISHLIGRRAHQSGQPPWEVP